MFFTGVVVDPRSSETQLHHLLTVYTKVEYTLLGVSGGASGSVSVGQSLGTVASRRPEMPIEMPKESVVEELEFLVIPAMSDRSSAGANTPMSSPVRTSKSTSNGINNPTRYPMSPGIPTAVLTAEHGPTDGKGTQSACVDQYGKHSTYGHLRVVLRYSVSDIDWLLQCDVLLLRSSRTLCRTDDLFSPVSPYPTPSVCQYSPVDTVDTVSARHPTTTTTTSTSSTTCTSSTTEKSKGSLGCTSSSLRRYVSKPLTSTGKCSAAFKSGLISGLNNRTSSPSLGSPSLVVASSAPIWLGDSSANRNASLGTSRARTATPVLDSGLRSSKAATPCSVLDSGTRGSKAGSEAGSLLSGRITTPLRDAQTLHRIGLIRKNGLTVLPSFSCLWQFLSPKEALTAFSQEALTAFSQDVGITSVNNVSNVNSERAGLDRKSNGFQEASLYDINCSYSKCGLEGRRRLGGVGMHDQATEACSIRASRSLNLLSSGNYNIGTSLYCLHRYIYLPLTFQANPKMLWEKLLVQFFGQMSLSLRDSGSCSWSAGDNIRSNGSTRNDRSNGSFCVTHTGGHPRSSLRCIFDILTLLSSSLPNGSQSGGRSTLNVPVSTAFSLTTPFYTIETVTYVVDEILGFASNGNDFYLNRFLEIFDANTKSFVGFFPWFLRKNLRAHQSRLGNTQGSIAEQVAYFYGNNEACGWDVTAIRGLVCAALDILTALPIGVVVPTYAAVMHTTDCCRKSTELQALTTALQLGGIRPSSDCYMSKLDHNHSAIFQSHTLIP